MLEALRKKKANGFDITISLGQPDGDAPVVDEELPEEKLSEEQEKLGLAPTGAQMPEEDEDKDQSLIQKMMMAYGLAGKGSLSHKGMMKKEVK